MAKALEGGSEALQSLLDTITKIDQINLTELDAAVEARRTKLDRFDEQLDKGVKGGRRKQKRPGRPYANGKGKQHWRTRRKYLKDYHQKVRAPKNRAKAIAALREKGWYGYLLIGWKRRHLPVDVTLEEWNEVVGTMENVVPFVTRYDTSVGIRLDNLLIRDRDTGETVFDGKEYQLKLYGCIS